MMGFAAEIQKWTKLSGLKGRTVMKNIGFDIYTGILLRSPVREGRFRGSNRIGINRKSGSVVPEGGAGNAAGVEFGDPPTSAESLYMNSRLLDIKWEDTIIFSNNLPYARPLEDGSSAQNDNKPDGIYGDSYEEVKEQLRAKIKKISMGAV